MPSCTVDKRCKMKTAIFTKAGFTNMATNVGHTECLLHAHVECRYSRDAKLCQILSMDL